MYDRTEASGSIILDNSFKPYAQRTSQLELKSMANMKTGNFLRCFGSWLLRWAMGFPVESGLRTIGNPDEDSPVFLTCNFYLTVKRVWNVLKCLDCYLLVANTRGINVWSSACGGDFNEHSVISVIKTSGIGNKVKHRILVLPQLSAPGMNVKEINKETGWTVKFGPVYAKDIPNYVKRNFKKTPEMHRLTWPLFERFEIATSCSLWLRLLFALIFALFVPSLFWPILGIGFQHYILRTSQFRISQSNLG